jgi:hypothetical protein
MVSTAISYAILGLLLATTAVGYQAENEGGGNDMGAMHSAEREIRELHAFFEVWFRGGIDGTDKEFARFSDALADSFTFIAPTGDSLNRAQILDGVRQTYAGDPDARVWIENVRILSDSDSLVVARYDEWQELGGEIRARVSTVVFSRDANAPHGLRWMTVHETWLPAE